MWVYIRYSELSFVMGNLDGNQGVNLCIFDNGNGGYFFYKL